MPDAKAIIFSMPKDMVRGVEQVAKDEHRTVSELLLETFRQYQSRKQIKKKGLTKKDFGRPFAK